MRRLRYGTGGKRKSRKSAAAAPVAGAATVEHRTFAFEDGQITEPKHRQLIRGGSLLTGYGRLDHPASANRLAMRCHSLVDPRADTHQGKTKNKG